MAEFKHMKLEQEGHVGIVTLCSAPVNTLTFEMLDELALMFDEIEKIDDIWAVVICSNMKVFCAGADVRNLNSCDRYGNIKTSDYFKPTYLKIENFKHPVICAVNGVAFGGGFELALACDLRVFGPKAKVALPEAGLGICPGAGGTVRLSRLIGRGAAKKMLFTGEPVRAEEAYRLGICEFISGEEDPTEYARKLAQQICTKSPMSISLIKKSANYATNNHSIEDSLDFETFVTSDVFSFEDCKEGTSAFFEKRTPIFKNK